MNNQKPISVNNYLYELSLLCSQKKFTTASPLYYEGHIPTAAYLVLEGSIHLIKNKKIKKTIKAGSIIAIKELLTNTIVEHQALVQPASTIGFIDKSTLLEITLQKKHRLSAYLIELLA
jgi:CRP-like cAMP-binding protein